MSLDMFDSIGFRLSIQLMSFIVALIVTQMSIVEWLRNQNTMYKCLALGFGIMFLEISMMTAVYSYSFITGDVYYHSWFPVINYFLKTVSYIYIAAGFMTSRSGQRSRFIKTNFSALVAVVPVIIVLWFIAGNLALQNVVSFWSNLCFEIWSTGLIIKTVSVIIKSRARIVKGLVFATSILLLKQLVHLTIIIADPLGLPALTLGQHFLQVAYFYIIITTLHKVSILDLLSAESAKTNIQEKSHQDAIRALVSSLEAKDEYTRGHSDRVKEYALLLGEQLGLEKEELKQLYYSSILHDIGKIGISEDILNSPIALCRDEYDRIKKHPEIGANIVSSIPSLKDIAPSILHHHEWFDGSGYPAGLKGAEIPLHARIIAIADAIDAMSSTRSYRHSMSEENAVHELLSGVGTQFDPHLAAAFIKALGITVTETDLQRVSRPA